MLCCVVLQLKNVIDTCTSSEDDFSQARKTPGCQIHLGDRPIQVSIVNMFRKSTGFVWNFHLNFEFLLYINLNQGNTP